MGGSNLDDDILFDVSGYVQFVNEFDSNTNTMTVKMQEFTEWSGAMLYKRPEKVNVQMGWWSL